MEGKLITLSHIFTCLNIYTHVPQKLLSGRHTSIRSQRSELESPRIRKQAVFR